MSESAALFVRRRLPQNTTPNVPLRSREALITGVDMVATDGRGIGGARGERKGEIRLVHIVSAIEASSGEPLDLPSLLASKHDGVSPTKLVRY